MQERYGSHFGLCVCVTSPSQANKVYPTNWVNIAVGFSQLYWFPYRFVYKFWPVLTDICYSLVLVCKLRWLCLAVRHVGGACAFYVQHTYSCQVSKVNERWQASVQRRALASMWTCERQLCVKETAQWDLHLLYMSENNFVDDLWAIALCSIDVWPTDYFISHVHAYLPENGLLFIAICQKLSWS